MSKIINFPRSKKHNKLVDKAEDIKLIIDSLVMYDVDINLVVSSKDARKIVNFPKECLTNRGKTKYPLFTFTTNAKKMRKLIDNTYGMELTGNLGG